MISRAELKGYVDELKNQFFEAPKAGLVENAISAKIDAIIREMWGDRPIPKSFALFAIGGYGRGTIHPESDIDLLFFFNDAIDEERVKVILHPRWNLHFKVGHQIRQGSDFKKFDETHMEAYTALLDSRFLLGNRPTADDFEREIFPCLVKKNRDRFLKALVAMKGARYGQFGNTVYQLEPDLTEAPGGLRDLHWAGW